MAKNYYNSRTGLKVSLEDLSDTQQRFLAEAQRRLRANVGWLAFDEFAFGAHSPLYAGQKSHKNVLHSPLYRALKDMSLQLGVQQGRITDSQARRPATKGEKAIA
jgi:hypothetical protein